MATDIGGFAGGYMAADEHQQNTQANADQHEQAVQTLAKGKMDLDATQSLLDAQTAAMMEMQQMSSKGPPQGAGGPAVQGAAGQAYKASEMSFAAGDVYMKRGHIQQGQEFMQKGAQLAASGAELEKQNADQSLKMWQHVGGVLEPIDPHSPTASQEWDKARMTFPHMFPEEAKHPEVQKFLQMSYSQLGPQGLDILKRSSMTAQQQAEEAKTKAEATASKANARLSEATIPLRAAEAKEHNARADAIGKAGGKPPLQVDINSAGSLIMADYPNADPKGYQLYATEISERAKQLIATGMDREQSFSQAYQEVKGTGKLENLPQKASAAEVKATAAKQESVADIDSILQMMDQGEASVGLGRKYKNITEFLSTATGIGDQETPQATMDAKLGTMLSRLPQALSKKGKLAADERDVIREIADLRKTFTTSATGKAKLEALRARLVGSDNPEGAAGAQQTFTKEADISAAIDAKKIKNGDTIIFNGKPMKVTVK